MHSIFETCYTLEFGPYGIEVDAPLTVTYVVTGWPVPATRDDPGEGWEIDLVLIEAEINGRRHELPGEFLPDTLRRWIMDRCMDHANEERRCRR